jgi:hypothetical protein
MKRKWFFFEKKVGRPPRPQKTFAPFSPGGRWNIPCKNFQKFLRAFFKKRCFLDRLPFTHLPLTIHLYGVFLDHDGTA